MKAVLDANVLLPTILREILTGLAEKGLFQPLWSERILREWYLAVESKLGRDHAGVAAAEIALMKDSFPGALVDDSTVSPDNLLTLNNTSLPDDDDRHVIATAIAGGAALIVTANLRDFPQRVMAALGLRAIHPDAFFLDLYRQQAEVVETTIQAVHSKAIQAGGKMTVVEMLKRSRLPRLARLQAS